MANLTINAKFSDSESSAIAEIEVLPENFVEITFKGPMAKCYLFKAEDTVCFELVEIINKIKTDKTNNLSIGKTIDTMRKSAKLRYLETGGY